MTFRRTDMAFVCRLSVTGGMGYTVRIVQPCVGLYMRRKQLNFLLYEMNPDRMGLD